MKKRDALPARGGDRAICLSPPGTTEPGMFDLIGFPSKEQGCLLFFGVQNHRGKASRVINWISNSHSPLHSDNLRVFYKVEEVIYGCFMKTTLITKYQTFGT